MNRLTGVGVGLVGFGAVLAAFSYFVLVNVPLTSLGLAFAILGLVVLILPEYLVPHEVVRGMISGSVANIEAVLEEFGATHKAIYLPPREGKVYAYIPLSGNPSYPEFSEIVNAPKRIISNVDGHPGLFIYPPGSDVVAVFLLFTVAFFVAIGEERLDVYISVFTLEYLALVKMLRPKLLQLRKE